MSLATMLDHAAVTAEPRELCEAERDRRAAIVLYWHTTGHPADRIAKAFGISRRTLYRYADSLAACGP